MSTHTRLLLSFSCILVNVLYVTNQNDFVIDQRFREENKNKFRPPPNPFFDTFYDKSYYQTGAQRPIYNVIIFVNFWLVKLLFFTFNNLSNM